MLQSRCSVSKIQTLREIHSLSKSGEMVILHLQIKALYDEGELETLLETIERRGAGHKHLGDGRYRVHIPTYHSWIPFYQTIRDCSSVELTDVTTVSQRRTILIEPEG
jgi:hypothetical protein